MTGQQNLHKTFNLIQNSVVPLAPHKCNGSAAMIRSLWMQVLAQHKVYSIWNGFITMNQSTEINII